MLVLGGTGFIGSWIARSLIARGHRVTVFTRTSKPLISSVEHSIDYVAGDLNDYDAVCAAMRGHDAVFHAAGYYPLFSLHREHQCREALTGLRTILNAAQESGIGKFIFTSSPAVLVEDKAAVARCTYHAIKRLLHDEVQRWIERGLPGMIAIPGACFGPDDRKPTTGRIVVEIASRRLRFIVEGKMNAVDVRDLAQGEVAMLERAAIGSCYQLGNWNCLFSEFARLVAKTANVPVLRIKAPYAAARAVATIGEWVQFHAGARLPLLPEAALDQIHYGSFLDSSNAVRDLSFTVRPVEQTVADTLDYFVRKHYIVRQPGRIGDGASPTLSAQHTSLPRQTFRKDRDSE